MQEETKVIRIIGRMASVLSVLMYVSYIPQIISNMHGDYGNPIQPLVAGINCTVWTIYGYFKAERDWPTSRGSFLDSLRSIQHYINS